MTTSTKWVRNPYILGCLIAFFCVLDLILLGCNVNLSKSDWASWVQAVGSVGAILVAVWVSNHQHKLQIRREKDSAADEVIGMLKSMRAEIETLYESSERNIGALLGASARGTPFRYVFPTPEHPFTIYDALAPRLGTISDDNLRSQIVRSYATAKSYVNTFRLHNEFNAQLNAAQHKAKQTSTEADQGAAEELLLVLTNYSDSLRDAHAATKAAVTNLLACLPH